MTFNQKAQRSIQQFGKLRVNLKSLCFAPKLKHQLCWHSSFLRPRCHQFLNFCNLSNNLNIITPFTLTWIFKFIIKVFQVGGFAAPPPSLLSSLPSHMLLHLEKVIWQIQSGRFNWKHLLNLTPLLHPLQKFRKPQNFFTMQPIWWKFGVRMQNHFLKSKPVGDGFHLLTSSRCRTLTD